MSQCPPEKREELRDLYLQADYGYISGDTFRKSVALLLGLSETEFDGMLDDKYIRNQYIFDLIITLKSNYKIGLLSNVNDSYIDLLFSREEQADIFDAITTSSAVGVLKPSPRIYQLAAKQLGVLPEECVFVDDIPVNVEGANNVGMKGILYTTNQQLKSDLKEYYA